MGKKIDRLRKLQSLTPQEFLASLLFYYVVNGKDHFFKTQFNEYPLWLEYAHENEDDAFTLDVLYLGQEHSFMLIKPDYKSVLAVAPQLLEWLQSTYTSTVPVVPVMPSKRQRGRRPPRVRPQRPQANTSLPNALQNSGQQASNNQKQHDTSN